MYRARPSIPGVQRHSGPAEPGNEPRQACQQGQAHARHPGGPQAATCHCHGCLPGLPLCLPGFRPSHLSAVAAVTIAFAVADAAVSIALAVASAGAGAGAGGAAAAAVMILVAAAAMLLFQA